MWDLHYEAALESFFATEGALAPAANRLRRMARQALSERAYWGSIANLLRGDPRLSLSLMRFAFTRSPMTVLVPPLGYLLRRDDVLKKITQLVAEAVRAMRAPVSERPFGQ